MVPSGLKSNRTESNQLKFGAILFTKALASAWVSVTCFSS
jgi:hypothetical protein